MLRKNALFFEQTDFRDLSKLNGKSTSFRHSNNYRLYSEADLLKLQQIIALKFFGFELSQIQTLLNRQSKIADNFAMQSRFLKEKASSLLEASDILERLSQDCSNNKSVPWQEIIRSIEVYKMTQQLEDNWVKEIFSPDELIEYAKFEEQLKANTTQVEKDKFEQGWFKLVEEFKEHLKDSPESKVGIELGKKLMDWVNNLYGKQYAYLRTKKFEQGFGEGKGLEEHGLTPEIVLWMEKSMDAYWYNRLNKIFDNINDKSQSELLNAWNELMEEMYGDEEERKSSIPKVILEDDKISKHIKSWISKTFNIK